MITELNTIVITIVVLLAVVPEMSCFQAASNRVLVPSTSIRSFGVSTAIFQETSNNKDNDDFGSTDSTGGETYDGDIDWDAEWKKVVEKRDQPSNRPGKYKNDVERALLQTTKATGEQIKKVKIVKPDINIRSLQGDAKFWIAILAVISVGISLISAAGVSTYSNSSDSFYI